MTHNMKLITLAAVSSLLMAGASSAQGPANPDPMSVKGGDYKVEPSHTQVIFKISHMGFSTYYGNFSNATGTLKLDPKDASIDSLDVTIPVSSVMTTSAKLTDELKSSDWLDATKFPTAQFQSTHVTVTGPGQAMVAGNLTLHGVTRPLTLAARFQGAGANPLSHAYTAGFEVSGTIRRSDFGVSKYVPLIGDEVGLTISGAFEHQPS